MTEWIPRHLEPQLARSARQRPVIAVTGARQTGKSSLVRRVFPDHGYVTLDLPSEADQAERDPSGFLARHPLPLIVDEVQYAPGLFRHLKARVDADRGRYGQFVLTGSQAFPLMRSVADSLAGRVEIHELEGLSYAELRDSGRDVPVEALLVRGSLPELWQQPELDATSFWRSYVATYLERDLRNLLAVSNLRDYERFLRAVALRSAQLLNKAELARDIGIAPSTAGAWLGLLEASNQVSLVSPWFSNPTRSLVKSPKLYVADSGLFAFLVGLRDDAELGASALAGAAWETLVASELRKGLKVGRLDGDLYFWADRSREVDFLLHRAGRFDLYEAKLTPRPDPRDAAVMRKVAADLGESNVRSRSVVCRAPHAYPLADGARVVPLSELVPG